MDKGAHIWQALLHDGDEAIRLRVLATEEEMAKLIERGLVPAFIQREDGARVADFVKRPGTFRGYTK